MQLQDLIALMNSRIEGHKKDLREINEYISEQSNEEDKRLPRLAAALSRAYLEEDLAVRNLLLQKN